MSLELYPQKASEPETAEMLVSFTGAGAANPTKVYGKGVTVTWTSTGLYKLTFSDPPGNLVCPGGPCFQATVPAGVKGYTAVFGAFDATGKIVSVSIYNSTFALADLAAAQTVSFAMVFKRAGITV
jgi:hypothetical protein